MWKVWPRSLPTLWKLGLISEIQNNIIALLCVSGYCVPMFFPVRTYMRMVRDPPTKRLPVFGFEDFIRHTIWLWSKLYLQETALPFHKYIVDFSWFLSFPILTLLANAGRAWEVGCSRSKWWCNNWTDVSKYMHHNKTFFNNLSLQFREGLY